MFIALHVGQYEIKHTNVEPDTKACESSFKATGDRNFYRKNLVRSYDLFQIFIFK